jgi:hypothetical protein
LIYRDDESFPTEEKKAEALSKFDGSHSTNKIYVTGYVPIIGYESDGTTPIFAQTEKPYTTNAWNDYSENYDLNKYALFVYQGATIHDVGKSVINELGLTDDSYKIESSFTLSKLISAGVPDYKSDDGVEDLEFKSEQTDFSLSRLMIRPNVYFITYTCNYVYADGTLGELEQTRPLIVLSRLGDLVLATKPSVNTSDSKYLLNYTSVVNKGNSLVAFRVADIVYSTKPSVNINDAKYLLNYTNIINKSTFAFYPEIE